MQFEMGGCACGNEDTQWSEYEGHLWCENCQKDFVPKESGVFSGPISAGAAKIMGIVFDRIDLSNGKIDRFDTKLGLYESEILKK